MASSSQTLEADPLWYKDAVIYEVHVKAFFDSNQDGIGDFPGLTQKLDYLQDLGVSCLWLLPFYPSPQRDDGYDISDYHGVHASYGTIRDFRHFVREAHRRGLRVVTELVVNHTSDQHPWFQASRLAPPGSAKRNFYVWHDTDQKYSQARIIFQDTEKSNWTWDPVAKAYYWHRFFSHQPDLNFDSPLVRRAVFHVMNYWFEAGVDGLRLDAVPYLVERESTNCENLPETHAVLKELRRQIDLRFACRMLLAEANQWPLDVRPYFGDGDECHMAFHFPIMPRIFMALRQEDRHPITDILRQTPDIPENCQWALFLRNHDELTLEMVTSEERDYMYKEYASDPRARLNLGIRRRLTPLMEGSRRRIELLYSLLCSLPGTPVIYYGDEIGMGDNIYLGDRNGVRTPMQWTSDRNAGFSRADPGQLYSPPVMDPVYGYQAINVESQQRRPSSLLNFVKHLLALRKSSKTFGRGTLEFLQPKNRKVLAYVRRYQDELLLVVANLSRYVQPADLDLSGFAGLIPVEMFGHVEFPAIGEQPYFLSLTPHSFFWFRLQRTAAPLAVPAGAASAGPVEALPSLSVVDGYEALLEGRARLALEQTVLPQYLPRQRWFGGKARTLRSTRLVDWTPLRSDMPLAFLTLWQVEYADGEADLYFVPLGVSTGSRAEALRQNAAWSAIARLQGPEGEGLLHDGLADDAVCETLLSVIEQGRELRTRKGIIRGFATAAFAELRGSPGTALPIGRGSAEHSNTNLFLGRQMLLKLFRRLQPGPNPDFEIGRRLSEQLQFARIPRLAGGMEYHRPWSEPTTLAMLQGLVQNQGDGWDHTLDELKRYFEQTCTQPEDVPPSESSLRTLLRLARPSSPTPVVEQVNGYLNAAAILGQRTAELHRALAQSTEEPAFAPEAFTAADLRSIAESMRRQARRSLAVLERTLSRLPPPVADHGRRLLSLRRPFLERLTELTSTPVEASKIRVHGDYHLGQVLWVENDFVILDFEGEPARPLAERRAKQSPLKDVAGMLRSFSYAVYTALFTFTQHRPEDFLRLEPWAKLWQMWVSASFLQAYRDTTSGASFVPADTRPFAALVELFLLDKALYELLYELDNRPDWVGLPLRGILSLLEPESAVIASIAPSVAAVGVPSEYPAVH